MQQRQKQYQRLAVGSLLPENVLNYQNKANELQNKLESSTIGLSNDEQYAINQYISSESYKINETLRNNIKLTDEQKRMRDNLDSVLNKCNNYNGNIVRVLEIKDKELLKDFLKKNKIGKIENWKEYLSFSDKESYNLNANIKIFKNYTRDKVIRK